MRLFVAASVLLGPSASWANPVGYVGKVGEVGTVGTTGNIGTVGSGINSGPMGSGSNLATQTHAPDLGSTLPGGPMVDLSPRVLPGSVNSAASIRPSVDLALPTAHPAARDAGGRTFSRTTAKPEQGRSIKTDAPAGEKISDPSVKPGGLHTLGKAVDGIEKGREKIAKGQDGELAGQLDQLFDFSRRRPSASMGTPEAGVGIADGSPVAGLPDPKVVGVVQALGKVSALAAGAAPTDAAYLYKHAMDIASDQMGGAQGAAKVSALKAEASVKGESAVESLGKKALASAAQGRTTDALRYTKAVHAWNDLLSDKKGPYISNFAEFSGSVKHVLGQALDKPGETLPAPAIRFVPAEGDGHLKALVSLPDGVASQVKALPADLPASLALPGVESFVAFNDVSLPEGPALHASFGLTPQAGLREHYRARRQAGDSVWKSFWIAARRYLSSVATGAWQRIRALLVSVLQKLGILRGGLTGLSVEASPQALERLRALPGVQAAAVTEAEGLRADGFGLGYSLFPAAP